jgi:hypothetical protein
MAGSSTEASIVMQARENKLQNLLARQGVRMTEQMQGCQAPIEAVQTKVLGEPVLQLILALRRGSVSVREPTSCLRRRVLATGRQTHSVEALNVRDMLVHI